MLEELEKLGFCFNGCEFAYESEYVNVSVDLNPDYTIKKASFQLQYTFHNIEFPTIEKIRSVIYAHDPSKLR